MAFQKNTKKEGDLLLAEDWNTINQEIERLEDAKLNRKNSTVEGSLSVEKQLSIGTEGNGEETLTVGGNVHYTGHLTQLKVGNSPKAEVRSAELNFGHNTQRGEPGRALVDLKNTLALNFENDWEQTLIQGKTIFLKGNVQIGAGETLQPLHIRGNDTVAVLESSSKKASLVIQTDGGSKRIALSSRDDGGAQLSVADNSSALTISPKGSVGIGMAEPSEMLSVGGVIESTIGGFKFPDGTVQTTAATATPASQVAVEKEVEPAKPTDNEKPATSEEEKGSKGWSLSGKDLLFLEGGNVGIDTRFPKCRLTVEGDVSIGSEREATLRTRYIDGKAQGNVNPDSLYLQYNTGKPIFVGQDVKPSELTIYGKIGIGERPGQEKLRIMGDASITGSINFGEDRRQMMNLWKNHYGIGVQSGTLYFRTDKNFAWYKNGNHSDNELNPGGGKHMLTIADGRVGIGTNEPAGHFHIKSLNTLGLFESTSDEAQIALYGREGSNYQIQFGYRRGGRAAIHVSSAGDVLNVTRPGHVGIGNIAPTSALDVKGEIKASLAVSSNAFQPLSKTWEIAENKGGLIIRDPITDPDEEEVHTWAKFNANKALHLMGVPDLLAEGRVTAKKGFTADAPASTDNVQMNIYNPNDGKGEVAGMRFHTNSKWNVMLRTNQENAWLELTDAEGKPEHRWLEGNYCANGKVGVGTQDPKYDLHVEGSAYIKGELTTSENFIRVVPKGFKVGGSFNQWYPILFQDEGWNFGALRLEIARTNAHLDSDWRGSLICWCDCHSSRWGHGADFWRVRAWQKKAKFVAGFMNIYYSNKHAIWLRGGGTTYYWRSNQPVKLLNHSAESKKTDHASLRVKTKVDPGFDAWRIDKKWNSINQTIVEAV